MHLLDAAKELKQIRTQKDANPGLLWTWDDGFPKRFAYAM